MSIARNTGTIEKPAAIKGVFSYDDVMKYLEVKYNFDQYNVSKNEDRHFDRWCDARGYTKKKKDSAGNYRSSSQIWWAEYQNDPEGMEKEPPQENFWHWLLQMVGMEKVTGGKPFDLPVGRLLDHYDTEIAPLLQPLYDKQYEASVEVIKRAVPPEHHRALLLMHKPKKAELPDFAKKVLSHIRTDFGDTLTLFCRISG